MKLRFLVSGITLLFLALSPASGDDASGDAVAAAEASTCAVVCFDADDKTCGMGTADTCNEATVEAVEVCEGDDVRCTEYRRGEVPRLSPVKSDRRLDAPCTYCVWDGHQYSPGARLCQGNGYISCRADGRWSAKVIGPC